VAPEQKKTVGSVVQPGPGGVGAWELLTERPNDRWVGMLERAPNKSKVRTQAQEKAREGKKRRDARRPEKSAATLRQRDGASVSMAKKKQ